MASNVIRFDNYHPEFRGLRVMQPGIQFEIYSHGLYLGFVRMLPDITAFGQDNSPLGGCDSIEEAIDALIAAAIGQEIATV